MHTFTKISVALFALSTFTITADDSRNLVLKKLKAKAKTTLSEDVKEFNSYRRPKSDGWINKSNVEEFLQKNIPLFLSSNEDYTEVYNYRWWMISKHLREHTDPKTKKRYHVFTEFFGKKNWASESWAITCPAGHQFYDVRWLRDPKYLRSYAEYYMGGPASKRNQLMGVHNFRTYIHRPESHHFSSWMIDGVEAFLKVHPDKTWSSSMLEGMQHHQDVWEELFTVKKTGAKTDGMYKILDVYDGMEFTISVVKALIAGGDAYEAITDKNWKEYYLGWPAIKKTNNKPITKEFPKAFATGYPQLYLVRPSNNAYNYANLRSLANIYEMSGASADKVNEIREKARKLHQQYFDLLWNENDQFFYSYTAADNAHGVKDWESKIRESVGYTPWYFNMIEKQNKTYDKAWEMFSSAKGFMNKKGMTTAEQTSPYYNEKAYAWNGRGWPFQNSVVYKAYANYLKNNKEMVTAAERELLYKHISQLVALHGSQRNIGEWYIPSNGKKFGGCKDYFHSTFPDMLIEDLLGFTSSHKDEFSINCLLPEEKWDHFYFGNLLYHGHEVDIIWKKDWDKSKTGNQSELCVWVDGKLTATSKGLNEKLTVKLR